jgi:tyrosyl-tRNA synthetase
LLTREEVDEVTRQHVEAPHLRVLQKLLARDLTIRVHSEEDYFSAFEASEILFGKGTTETLKKLSEETLLSVFEGVPQSEVAKSEIAKSINIVDFLTEKTQIFPSKGEARRMLKDGGVALNKEKVTEDFTVTSDHLLREKYLLIQKGKKNYYLVKAM